MYNNKKLRKLLLTARGHGTHDWNNEISFPKTPPLPPTTQMPHTLVWLIL